jgi:hypothetical protein
MNPKPILLWLASSLMAVAPMACGQSSTTNFAWAKRIASTTNPDNELAVGLAMDRAANLYVAGWFDGANDFGGGTLVNKNGGGQDIFVGKYNSAGALQWARRAGGSTASRDAARGVGVDDAGNVYVTGGVYGDADFGNFNVTASQRGDFFLAKYDSAGIVQWVGRSNGGGSDGVYGTGLAVDGAGNSYAVGFADNVSAITFGAVELRSPSATGYSAFLVKHDQAGTVKWAQLLGGQGQTYTTKVVVNPAGDICLGGSFSGTMAIGSTTLVSAGGRDLFVAKFDSAGALLWVRQAGGAGDDTAESGVAMDAAGNVWISGAYGSNPIAFGGTSLANAGAWDAFVAKYNSAGTLQWARRAGGAGMDM